MKWRVPVSQAKWGHQSVMCRSGRHCEHPNMFIIVLFIFIIDKFLQRSSSCSLYSSLVIFVDDIFIANSIRLTVKRLRPLFERSVINLRWENIAGSVLSELKLIWEIFVVTHAPIDPRCDRCTGRVPSRDKGRISPSPNTISGSRVSISIAAKVSVSISLKCKKSNPCH